MEFKKAGEHAVHTSAQGGAPVNAKRKQMRKPIIGGLILLVVVIALVLGTFLVLTKTGAIGTEKTSVNKNEYQAVFLTNGQVYFGKLADVRGDYLALNNIYYLQVDSSIQSGTTAATTTAAATSSDSNVQLIKLGNELHGPEDSMQISSKQVLFWENLKSDSKVSQAIANYKPAK